MPGSTGGGWKRNATASPRQPSTQPSSSSTSVRAIPLCRHDSAIPSGLGDRLVPQPGQLNGTAAKLRRPGCRHLGLPSGGHRRRPTWGVRESGGTPAPRVGSGCPAVRGQPRDSKLLYTPSWASGSGVPSENAYPRQIVCVGRTGSSARDGLAPLTPASARRAAAGGMAWPSMIYISTSRSATVTAQSPPPR
jgi:hypothetical protein